MMKVQKRGYATVILAQKISTGISFFRYDPECLLIIARDSDKKASVRLIDNLRS